MAQKVAAVVLEGSNPFEFSVACEVFGLARPELGVQWYDFRLCAPDGEVTVNGGWVLKTPHGLDATEDADLVIIPTATPRRGGTPQAVLDAVSRAADRGARVMSFCSGAFALAEAGVLDGRRATTHWMYTERFRADFPRVKLDPNVLFVDEGNVLTSAGTAAGIDLSLHVVRGDYGADVAAYVARRMVVPPHRDGGQAQFIQAPPAPRVQSGDLAVHLDWYRERLSDELTVTHMASRAAMSERTFARRFKEATGTTPRRWLLNERLHRAQELLETTGLSLDAIAFRCGFGTATNLRQHFRAQLGTTPSGYRRAFQGAG